MLDVYFWYKVQTDTELCTTNYSSYLSRIWAGVLACCRLSHVIFPEIGKPLFVWAWFYFNITHNFSFLGNLPVTTAVYILSESVNQRSVIINYLLSSYVLSCFFSLLIAVCEVETNWHCSQCASYTITKLGCCFPSKHIPQKNTILLSTVKQERTWMTLF